MSMNSDYTPSSRAMLPQDGLIHGYNLSKERGHAAASIVAEHARESVFYQSVLLPIMNTFYKMSADWFKELTGYKEKLKNTKDPEARSYYEKAFGMGRYMFRGLAIRAREIFEKIYKPMQQEQLDAAKAEYDKITQPIIEELDKSKATADNADKLKAQLYSI